MSLRVSRRRLLGQRGVVRAIYFGDEPLGRRLPAGLACFFIPRILTQIIEAGDKLG